MKLEDVSMQELIEQPLFWEDFEEDRTDPAILRAAIEADPGSIEKIRFLDQVETGTLLDRSSLNTLAFISPKASIKKATAPGASRLTILKTTVGFVC